MEFIERAAPLIRPRRVLQKIVLFQHSHLINQLTVLVSYTSFQTSSLLAGLVKMSANMCSVGQYCRSTVPLLSASLM